MSDKKEIGRCKDCKHFECRWDGYGNCENYDYDDCYDSLLLEFKVGENFGCIHWEAREQEDE